MTTPCATCGQPSKYNYHDTQYDSLGLAAAELLTPACSDHRRTIPELFGTTGVDCDGCSAEACGWPTCQEGR